MPVSKKRKTKPTPLNAPPRQGSKRAKRLYLPDPHGYHPWPAEKGGPPEQCSLEYGHPGLAWAAMRRIANSSKRITRRHQIAPGVCPHCGIDPPMQPGLYYKDPAIYETSHPELIYVHSFEPGFIGGITLTLRRPPGYLKL